MLQRLLRTLLLLLVGSTLAGHAQPSTEDSSETDALTLRLAVWNIANLHHEDGVALRDGRNGRPPRPSNIRDASDYQLLRQILSEDIKPDIIALQEIGSPQAARRLFDATEYDLIFSDRYAATNPNDDGARGDIYTAYAIRRDAVTVVSSETRNEFSILAADGRPTRSALELRIDLNGTEIALLNVHLKSGCWALPLNTSAAVDADCPVIDQQIGILENWIDAEERSSVPFYVMGDFNRRIDQMARHGTGVIAQLDDQLPETLKIYRQPFGSRGPVRSPCWFGNWDLYYQAPIDFFLMNKPAFERSVRGSFEIIDLKEYATDRHEGRNGKRLSDHCPMVMSIN